MGSERPTYRRFSQARRRVFRLFTRIVIMAGAGRSATAKRAADKTQSLTKKRSPRMDVANRALCYTLRHPPKGQRKMSEAADICFRI